MDLLFELILSVGAQELSHTEKSPPPPKNEV